MTFNISSLDRLENSWRNPVPEMYPASSIHQSSTGLIPIDSPRYFPRKPASARDIHDYIFPIGPKLPVINPEIEARQRAWAEVRAKQINHLTP